jgi:hypothetical protein
MRDQNPAAVTIFCHRWQKGQHTAFLSKDEMMGLKTIRGMIIQEALTMKDRSVIGGADELLPPRTEFGSIEIDVDAHRSLQGFTE